MSSTPLRVPTGADSSPLHVGTFSLEETLSSPLSGSMERVSVARLEERGLELDPLARFENQVTSHWLPTLFPEKIEQTMSLYRKMKADGHVTIKEYTARDLAALQKKKLIQWCEPVLAEGKIDSFIFPMDPEKDLLTGADGGPVIFVGTLTNRERFSVMQGNHRTAAVLLRGQERNESLYVVRFRGSGDCQKLIGASPESYYLEPQFPAKYSHVLLNGAVDAKF